jgi:tRNA threonylcarbamoyladenosine modification (KEOPS) complex  Pcc1 subunit
MHGVCLEIPCHDAEVAEAVHGAIAIEAADGPEGSQVTLRRDGSVLAVTVEATDLSGLKAASHGLVRLVDLAIRAVSGCDPTANKI